MKMKKIISIVLIVLAVGLIAFFSVTLIKSSNVEAIEIVGEIQTIYFVDSTNDVNFNEAELKITYKDGTVKVKPLSAKLVDVSFFSTSVENNGTMKISYKSKEIDVGYSVISKGLYFLSGKTTKSYNGTTIDEINSGDLVAGVNANGVDITTSEEMIYFGDDGVCDYYYKANVNGSKNWVLINGYNNKDYYYKISGDTINVHLGEQRVLNMVANHPKQGSFTLDCVENKYAEGSNDFIKSKTSMSFSYYNMKGNRTFNTVSVYCPETISFAKNSKFSDSSLDIYLVVNYVNDSFMKTVYVKFNETMFNTENEFNTSTVTSTKRKAKCHFNGVQFELAYTVY